MNLQKLLMAGVALLGTLGGCSNDEEPPTFSIASFDIQGRVTNGLQPIVSSPGDLCLELTYADCGDTTYRVQCFDITTDEAGKFDRTVSVTAGQNGCREETNFYSVAFFVELPDNAIRYVSDDVVTDYCRSTEKTRECRQTMALRFVPPQTPSESVLPPFLANIQTPVFLPPFNSAPLLRQPFAKNSGVKVARSRSVERRKTIDISKRDAKVGLPNFLSTQREDLKRLLGFFGANEDSSSPSISQAQILLSKWGMRSGKVKEAFLDVKESISELFPEGIPEEIQEDLLQQVTYPESIKISDDRQHATIRIQLEGQSDPIFIDLRKGTKENDSGADDSQASSNWVVDRIRGEIETVEDSVVQKVEEAQE